MVLYHFVYTPVGKTRSLDGFSIVPFFLIGVDK
jgi:hypothetical protein